MHLPREPLAQPGAQLGDAPREITLRLAALARDHVEAANGERGSEQESGHIGHGAREEGDDQRAQPERAGLGQGGSGERPLHVVGDGACLGIPIVAPDGVPRHPADRLEQRLPVVGEAAAHLPDHALAVALDLPPVDVAAHVLPRLQVPLHDPVDDPASLCLELGRRVADHFPLEGAPHPVAVQQGTNPPDPERLLEEPHAALLHVAEQHVEPGEPRLDVAYHLVVEQGELPVDALDGLDVLRQQLEPLERDVLVPGREAEPDVERVQQLEADPLLLVERAH
jgi:hypothetical protein